jgi:biotin operon repressor
MANQVLLKRINRARILNAIRRYSPVSRSRIADRLGLDRKSVTNLVAELLAEGLVRESGTRKASRGRPLTMLELRRDRFRILGLALSATGAEGIVTDLYGAELRHASRRFPLDAPLPLSLFASSVPARLARLSDGGGGVGD